MASTVGPDFSESPPSGDSTEASPPKRWALHLISGAILRNDLQASFTESVLQIPDTVGDGVGKSRELIEDRASDVVVDDIGVPVHFLTVGVDLEVEERAACLLSGGQVAYPGLDAVASAETEPDPIGSAFPADEGVANSRRYSITRSEAVSGAEVMSQTIGVEVVGWSIGILLLGSS